MKQMRSLMLLSIFLFLLVACGGAEEAPPTALPPTTVEEPVAAVPTATTAVITAPTNEPDEPLPPPPTVAPAPTSTVAPDPVVEEATAVPIEIISLLSPADFGTDRNPLTGELMTNPADLQRRPLAVKLSNSPPSYTRPQSGLNQADLVFEHTTEGNITRFTAIFYGQTPEKVGPIRSARLIDVELPAMYDAALFYSGTSTGVGERLRGSDIRSPAHPQHRSGWLLSHRRG